MTNSDWSWRIPPQRKFWVGEKDDWLILIDLDGSHPKEKLGWENRKEGKNWPWPQPKKVDLGFWGHDLKVVPTDSESRPLGQHNSKILSPNVPVQQSYVHLKNWRKYIEWKRNIITAITFLDGGGRVLRPKISELCCPNGQHSESVEIQDGSCYLRQKCCS